MNEVPAPLKSFVVTKESLAWLTPQVLRALEDSYRRGYSHGSSQCLDFVTSKTPIQKLVNWVDVKIQNWASGDLSKKILPPTL